MSNVESSFTASDNHVFLEDGGAAVRIRDTGAFWRELMSGKVESEIVRRVGEGSGWLLALMQMGRSSPHWERHPSGDEILMLVSGEMTVVLEEGDAERRVDLSGGGVFIVPKGAWHKLETRRPCQLLAVTFGKGTEHRAV